MSDVVLRRYRLPSEAYEGWAIIVIGSDGFFSAVSDWGNYAYIWTHPGCEFRKFLTQVEPHYFWTKITHGREARVWDEEQVERNIRSRLDELVANGELTPGRAELAFEEAEGCIDNVDALMRWVEDENLPESFNVYEGIAATCPEPQSWAFATKVLPRLQALLRAELEAEATQASAEVSP